MEVADIHKQPHRETEQYIEKNKRPRAIQRILLIDLKQHSIVVKSLNNGMHLIGERNSYNPQQQQQYSNRTQHPRLTRCLTLVGLNLSFQRLSKREPPLEIA